MNIRDVINRTAQQTATNAGNELITSIRDVIKGQANRQADRQAATQRAYADNARAAQATAEGTIDFGEKEAEEPKAKSVQEEKGAKKRSYERDPWDQLNYNGNAVELINALDEYSNKNPINSISSYDENASRKEIRSQRDPGNYASPLDFASRVAMDQISAHSSPSVPVQGGISDEDYAESLDDFAQRRGYADFNSWYTNSKDKYDASMSNVAQSILGLASEDAYGNKQGLLADLAEDVGSKSFDDKIPQGATEAVEKAANDEDQESTNTTANDEGEPQLTAAIRNAFAPRSQAASYYDWLANSDEGKRFADEYGDYADDQYGYTALRASGDTEAWAKLLGLTDDYEGLDDFRNRYRSAGVDLDSDNAVDSLMSYLYGPNAVNLIDYMNYNRGSLGNEADSIADAGKYLATYYDWQPLPREQQAMGLDMDDMGYLALLHQITSDEGWGPHLTLKGVQDVANKAGEGGTFALVPEDSDEFKNNQRNNPKKYDTLDILDMLAQNTDVYEGGSSPILANASDTVIDAYNKSHKNGPRMVLR